MRYEKELFLFNTKLSAAMPGRGRKSTDSHKVFSPFFEKKKRLPIGNLFSVALNYYYNAAS